jgi:hypothetical protein
MQHVRGPFPPEFRYAAALVLTLIAAAPAMAQQTIYKWVDERGVVNYGNAQVPKNSNVSLVDTTPRVAASTDAKPAGPAARTGRLSDADVLREQLARSQDEISRLKQAAGGAPARRPDFATWRLQCEKEHHVDCNEETYNALPKAAAQAKPARLEVATTPKGERKTSEE